MRRTTSFLPPRRQSPSSDFPASGEGILHFSHPQHPLVRVDQPDLFTCTGCKEFGAGKRYTCPQCDLQIHDFCALAPPALKTHPLHFQHKLLFYYKPVKAGILKPRCDVCSKAVKGCSFRCIACNYQMHPCCAMLSNEINVPSHPHTLKILQYSSSSDSSFVCGECSRKRSGRVYHCTVCDYHVHAVCAKNMINGLEDNGLKGVDKSSMIGSAARVASQVVIEFIGGLIEGLGEGVGQVLLQSVTRSGIRSHNRT